MARRPLFARDSNWSKYWKKAKDIRVVVTLLFIALAAMYWWHNLVGDAKLHSVLNAAATRNGVVIVTIFTDAWKDVLDTWLERAKSVRDRPTHLLSHVVVLSLDKGGYEYCRTLPVHCYFDNQKDTKERFDFSGDELKPDSIGFHALTWRKVQLVRKILALGYHVIYTDLDTIWLKTPPLPLLHRPSSDIIFSSTVKAWDPRLSVPNPGLWYMHSNSKTIGFVDYWLSKRDASNLTHNEGEILTSIRPEVDSHFTPKTAPKIAYLLPSMCSTLCSPRDTWAELTTVHVECHVGVAEKLFKMKEVIDHHDSNMRKFFQFNRRHNPDNLETMASSVALSNRVIIVTSFVGPDKALLDLFLKRLKKLDTVVESSILVLTFDKGSYFYCVELKLECFFDAEAFPNMEPQRIFSSRGFERRLAWRRVVLINELIHQELKVLYTAPGVIWLKDPLPALLEATKDFSVACSAWSENSDSVVANTSLWFARNNDKGKAFLQYWTKDHETKYPFASEQEVFSTILPSLGAPDSRAPNLDIVYLPTTKFGSLCERTSRYKDLLTINADCVSEVDKHHSLLAFLQLYDSAESGTSETGPEPESTPADAAEQSGADEATPADTAGQSGADEAALPPVSDDESQSAGEEKSGESGPAGEDVDAAEPAPVQDSDSDDSPVSGDNQGTVKVPEDDADSTGNLPKAGEGSEDSEKEGDASETPENHPAKEPSQKEESSESGENSDAGDESEASEKVPKDETSEKEESGDTGEGSEGSEKVPKDETSEKEESGDTGEGSEGSEKVPKDETSEKEESGDTGEGSEGSEKVPKDETSEKEESGDTGEGSEGSEKESGDDGEDSEAHVKVPKEKTSEKDVDGEREEEGSDGVEAVSPPAASSSFNESSPEEGEESEDNSGEGGTASEGGPLEGGSHGNGSTPSTSSPLISGVDSLPKLLERAGKTVIITAMGPDTKETLSLQNDRLQRGQATASYAFRIIVITQTPEDYLYCQNLNNFLCYLHPNSTTATPQEMSWIRIELIQKVLEMGYDVIFSDDNVFWLKDPLPYVNEAGSEYDFVGACEKQLSGGAKSIPTGAFWKLANNDRSLKLIQFWVNAHNSNVKYAKFNDEQVLQRLFSKQRKQVDAATNVTFACLDAGRFGSLCKEAASLESLAAIHIGCALDPLESNATVSKAKEWFAKYDVSQPGQEN